MFQKLEEGQQAQELEAAVAWLQTTTRVSPHSRWHTYLRDLQGLARAKEVGDAFIPGRSEFDLQNSLYEAAQLVEIHKAFGQESIPGLESKLQDIAHGPVTYTDETDSSGGNRNTQFELFLAATLVDRGCNIRLDLEGHGSDFAIELADVDVVVECKRLSSENRVEKNIKKAFEQTATRIEQLKQQGRPAFGTIALSIDKLDNKTFQHLRTKDAAGVGRGMVSKCNAFETRYRKYWRNRHSDRDIGVIIQFACIAYVENPFASLFARQTALAELTTRNTAFVTPKIKALDALYEVIQPDNRVTLNL